MIRVAINGFGRIGRLVYRIGMSQGGFEFVGVNDLVPADNLAYLVKYDTMQGRFQGTLSSKKSSPDKAEDDILVGAQDAYEARCRKHFDPDLAMKPLTESHDPLPLLDL